MGVRTWLRQGIYMQEGLQDTYILHSQPCHILGLIAVPHSQFALYGRKQCVSCVETQRSSEANVNLLHCQPVLPIASLPPHQVSYRCHRTVVEQVSTIIEGVHASRWKDSRYQPRPCRRIRNEEILNSEIEFKSIRKFHLTSSLAKR